MRCILLESTDPYFNVATDEYVLKNMDEDCFMLWRNDNAVVVGKFQNILGEVNYNFVKQKDIKLVRRLSGGGAVYHDMGNINFTFTEGGRSMNLANFKKFTLPIIEVLNELGVETELGETGNISTHGLKISGNAAHIFRNKILHHGTLLFNSDMDMVRGSLKIDPSRYISRAIKSVPKPTTNIESNLKKKITIEDFMEKIMTHMERHFENTHRYYLSETDKRAIQKLRNEKYTTWEWTFGRSPAYAFHQKELVAEGVPAINLEVENGIIQKAEILGGGLSGKQCRNMAQSLVKHRHEENELRMALHQLKDRELTESEINRVMAHLF